MADENRTGSNPTSAASGLLEAAKGAATAVKGYYEKYSPAALAAHGGANISNMIKGGEHVESHGGSPQTPQGPKAPQEKSK
jgi:hypothetical protein